MIEAVLVLSAIALLSSFVRGAIGAADSIVFNGVFLTVYALGLAGPLSLRDGLYWLSLTHVASATIMLLSLARSLRFEPITVRFLIGTLPVNVAFSILLTRGLDGRILTLGLAVAVVLAGLYLALRPTLPPADMVKLNRWATPVGMLSGVLGGLFGMGAPVSLLLFTRAADDPTLFRMRLTVVTASVSFVRVIALASQGVYTSERLITAGWTIPAVATGIALGLRAHRFIRPGPFRTVLGGLIVVAGGVTLLRSLLG